MRFWDASALLPLILVEPQTDAVRALLEKDKHVVVWWGAIVECCSALARLHRRGHLDAAGQQDALGVLGALAGEWTEVEATSEVRRNAERVLRIHPLRAAGALQLSAALVWTGLEPSDQAFVCFDERLREAARKEGFCVLPR